jgi:hypothetical protein
MEPGPNEPSTPPPPPHQGPPPPPPPPHHGGYGPGANWPAGARMPIPGNAEWVMWLVAEIIFLIVWAASPAVTGATFITMTAIVTFAYLVSRGIAKASRVLEQ